MFLSFQFLCVGSETYRQNEYFVRAVKLIDSKEWEAAITPLKRALVDIPEHWNILQLLSAMYLLLEGKGI